MGTFSTWKSSTATRTMFEFIHRDGLEHYRFYRIPKLLMEDDIFRPLSTEAKLLYGLFLDRLELSLMNDWFDEEGRAFIIFTVKEVEHQLHCGHDKAIHLLAELDTPKGIGLIQRQHQGPGIPEGSMAHIFNRFYQSESSHSGEGSGLGLALVKQILETVGGTISVQNLQQGCRFRVILPRAEQFNNC